MALACSPLTKSLAHHHDIRDDVRMSPASRDELRPFVAHTNAEIVTKGLFGFLMGPMMWLQMTQLMRVAVDDLKCCVENGRPHLRRQRAARILSALPASGGCVIQGV